MKQLLLTVLSRAVSAVRLALGALAFTPLLALVVYVNYTVDCQGYFLGDLDLRGVAELLLAGENIVGYDQLIDRQREVLDTLILNLDDDAVPETIALGSSRVMQLSQEMVGTSFYNSGMSGADFYELLSTFYLYDRRDRLPKNVIVGVDAWIFSTDVDAQDKRSDKMLYAEFVSERLGVPMEYEKEESAQNWQYLFDLSYFQGNVEYSREEVSADGQMQTVPDEKRYTLEAEVKCSDGSIIYGKSFRSRPQEEVDRDALFQTSVLFRLENYPAPDAERLAIFEKWLQYMQQKDINVIFFLAPYPPIVYDHVLENAEQYGGLLGTEEAVRALGKRYDIPVYGSYDPYAVPAEDSDFYDGIHPRRECVARLFPGVPKALADRDAGVDVSLKHPDRTAEEDAEEA